MTVAEQRQVVHLRDNPAGAIPLFILVIVVILYFILRVRTFTSGGIQYWGGGWSGGRGYSSGGGLGGFSGGGGGGFSGGGGSFGGGGAGGSW